MGIFGILSRITEVEATIDKAVPKVSLETFLETISDNIDKEILKRERTGDVRFLGGKMYFNLSENSRKIVFRAEMFFRSNDNTFEKDEKNGEYYLSMLNQDAHYSFIDRIKQEGEIMIDITKPKR